MMKKAFKNLGKATLLGATGYLAFDYVVTNISDTYLTPIKTTKLGLAFERVMKNR